MALVFDGIRVNKDNYEKALSSELFATGKLIILLRKG